MIRTGAPTPPQEEKQQQVKSTQIRIWFFDPEKNTLACNKKYLAKKS